jgi:hypothetical protein
VTTRARYGSSWTVAEIQDTVSDSGNLGRPEPAHRGNSWNKHQNDSTIWLGKRQLVPCAKLQGYTHGQGSVTPGRDLEQARGGLWKSEVTHVVIDCHRLQSDVQLCLKIPLTVGSRFTDKEYDDRKIVA